MSVGKGIGGGGGGSWCLQERVEPGLKTVQWLGCHNLLGQSIPIWYGPGEERHLSVLCPAGWDVVAAGVFSGAPSAAWWFWQVAGVDGRLSRFVSTETISLLGTGVQDGHLDFHTAPELCLLLSGGVALIQLYWLSGCTKLLLICGGMGELILCFKQFSYLLIGINGLQLRKIVLILILVSLFVCCLLQNFLFVIIFCQIAVMKADGTPVTGRDSFVTLSETISSSTSGGTVGNPQTRSPVNGIVEFETYLGANAQTLRLRVSSWREWEKECENQESEREMDRERENN